MSTSSFSLIEPSERDALLPLFAEHNHLRTVICAILKTGMGTAVTDNPANPNVANLHLEFNFLGGDAAHPAAAEMLEGLRGMIVAPNGPWRDLIYQTHGERVKTHSRYACDGAELNVEHLRSHAANVPAEFSIKPIDLLLAQQIRQEVSPDLVDNFGSLEAFIAHGFGFCAVHSASGRTVCGASTFAACGRDIEIEIDTHPHYRRQGLATAVAAHLIIHCLENNIHPHWDAHNPTSARLAQRLGYQLRGSYETYLITNGF